MLELIFIKENNGYMHMLFTQYELNLNNKIHILMFSLPFVSFECRIS